MCLQSFMNKRYVVSQAKSQNQMFSKACFDAPALPFF